MQSTRRVMSLAHQARVVVLDYAALSDPKSDLSSELRTAFGPSGLGVCLVKNVPGYSALRTDLLTRASALSQLPKDTLEAVSSPQSTYNFGWSHGREVMNGRPDLSKGSFYNNPIYNAANEDPEYQKRYPHYGFPNVYPPEDDVPGLQRSFESLGSLIYNTSKLLAAKCDIYLSSQFPELKSKSLLSDCISGSKTTKARLLHYFPAEPVAKDDIDSWCGRHVDHSILTGLTAAMYIDDAVQDKVLSKSGKTATPAQKLAAIRAAAIPQDLVAPGSAASGPESESVSSELSAAIPKDAEKYYREALRESGLYICPRENLSAGSDAAQVNKDASENISGTRFVKIDIPEDMLAFQVGEAAQLASRGLFVATPHLVRGASAVESTSSAKNRISRNTFACFIQPNVDRELKPGYTFHDFTVDVMNRHY